MAIIDVIKMWSRSKGDFHSQDLRKRTAKFTEGWTVSHDPGEPKQSILDATGLPKVGNTFENLPWVFARRQVIVQQFPVLTIVDIEYEGEVGPGGVEGSPIDDPPEIRWGNIVSVVPVDQAADGTLFTTANYEVIEGFTRPVSDFVLNVKRNFLFLNMPAIAAYLDSVNSDTFQGFLPGTAHLDTFDANHVIAEETGNGYWEVSSEVQFRTPYKTTPDKAWWHRYAHMGYRVRNVDDGRVVHGTDSNQAPVNKPVPLTLEGYQTFPAFVPWIEKPMFSNTLPYTALGLV